MSLLPALIRDSGGRLLIGKDICLTLQGDFGEIAEKEQSAYIESRFIWRMFVTFLFIVIFYKRKQIDIL